MKEIKCVTIEPNSLHPEPLERTIHLKDYTDLYSILECKTFDILSLNFNGVYLDIYLDDEGKFKPNNGYSIAVLNGKERLVDIVVGNVLIARHNDDGDIESLTDDDIQNILSCCDKRNAILKGLV